MSRKLRVLALVREGHVPPESTEGYSDDEIDAWKAEFDVVDTLKSMGHEVLPLGVYDDLGPIRKALRDFEPHIVFMLLEEFHGVVTYDHAVASYLELMRQPYTGCNPRGMLLSKDKSLCKKILAYHRIPSPKFTVFPRGRRIRRPKRLAFPLFVKSATEDASLGISRASIVRSDEALVQRVGYLHDLTKGDVLVEQYIEGREIYVGVIGNERLQTFPTWELLFSKTPDDQPKIATRHVKWDRDYQERHGIITQAAEGFSPALDAKIHKICKRVYRALGMSGYARMDLRVTTEGQVYVIEANANPNIEFGEDFAESAESIGIGYESLLQRIINLGLRYRAPWQWYVPG